MDNLEQLTYNLFIFTNFQGTGSAGATVRIYIEQFESDASKHDVDAQIALKPLIGRLTIPLPMVFYYAWDFFNPIMLYFVIFARSGLIHIEA